MSVFPAALDSDLEIPRVDNNVTEISGEAINSIRDAIFSIETAIGINPQGNSGDLTTRVNVSIDANGNIKESALELRGLVTLPIVNSQIGSSAGILESKLDLDYATSLLNGNIASNVTDIGSIRTAFNGLVARSTKHFVGTGDRHDGYQIDLTTVIRGNTDVESIVNTLNNALTNHETLQLGVHQAGAISVINSFDNFSSTNVQTALSELDRIESLGIEQHQDRMHTTSVLISSRGEQGDQGNLKETVLAGTIYQTDKSKATNIFQVMRPNVARVSSKDMDLMSLQIGNSQRLRVQAGGCGRSTLDIDLSSIIPTDDINEIVDLINVTAHNGSEHYPISAYSAGGKITIAHTIPGNEFTIQILDDIQFSAATSLGFSQVLGTVFYWADNKHSGYVGGKRVEDLKPLIKKYHTHSNIPANTILLGLGDLSAFGLTTSNEGRVLCNITNHSLDPSINGTYYIISFPDNETFILNEDITAGEFDIEIAADSINFLNSASGEVYDAFVEEDGDGYGIVTKSNRVSYGPINGVDLSSVSENFPLSGMYWQIVDSGYIKLLNGNESGVSVSIPTSFNGQLRVFAPDNINSALFEVTGNPATAKKSISAYSFSGTEDKLYIGSVHYSGNYGLYTLKHATDRRQFGGSIDNKSDDKLAQTKAEDTSNELRSNGVVYGLDIISFSNSSFRLRGGKALIDGRLIDIKTQDITVDDFSASGKLLLLDRNGNFFIKDEFDPGYSFSELTSGNLYGDDRGVAIICEFETDGVAIDGYFTDKRLMVDNIDRRLINTQTSLEQEISEVRSVVSGSMWGFTVAESSVGGTGDDDGYLAGIEMGANNGLSYVPGDNETILSARGFNAGSALITTRRFEFSDPGTIVTSIFRAPGLTHINVFIEMIYTGIKVGEDGPFGVSGTVYVDVGIAIEYGMSNTHVYEGYARVKTINAGVFSSDSQVERYVASIPVSDLNLPENIMFDLVPRVRIVNSNYVDGGVGPDTEPTIRFDNIRIVTSSYNIAGSIDDVDGSSSSIGVAVGEIL